MTTFIHPLAIVSEHASIGDNCVIEAFSIIDGDVVIGDDNHIGPGVHIKPYCRIGQGNTFSNNCCIGYDPQHINFDTAAKTGVIIGAHNVFREFCTVHRSTERENTLIGDYGLFMVSNHVAHDCVVGSHVIMSNNSVLAGFVRIDDYVNLSAYVAVHQYCNVGRHAMVGAYSKIVQDVIPFALVDGNPPKVYDANSIGLRRTAFSSEERRLIRNAIKIIYRESGTPKRALETLDARYGDEALVREIIDFIKRSTRGII
jgi:UDP-N-acetylglucosamine acyltransferase